MVAMHQVDRRKVDGVRLRRRFYIAVAIALLLNKFSVNGKLPVNLPVTCHLPAINAPAIPPQYPPSILSRKPGTPATTLIKGATADNEQD